jgi:Transposase IS116/IS110/IS902 family
MSISDYDTGDRASVERLTRDMKAAAKTMSADEARFLVDYYYMVQEDRKRSTNQERALNESAEPHAVLTWLAQQSGSLEGEIKKALDAYTDAHPMGAWMRGIVGIGPVIAAGLLAHIDIAKAPTVGHIWRFAGLDPSTVWTKGKKRPWNAKLKTLCWKVGQSFMKQKNHPDCFYGKLYDQRKAYEIERNDKGGNRAVALQKAEKYNKSTEAYAHLAQGKLPPAQIDARARRFVVKIFLSHLHAEWYRKEFGTEPPAPYALAQLGHAHMINPPSWFKP